MKKNLQLTALALALCCFGVNAQNKTVGSHQPMLSNSGNNVQGTHKHETPTRNCGTQVPHGEWENWSAEKLAKAEMESVEFMNNYTKGNKQMVVYNIPIVFHIVHGNTAVGSGINITQAQVLSQFNILNNDFKSAGVNSSLCPSAFLSLKADCEINFCLATRNPTGGVLAEPGIDRRSYTSITGLAAPGSGYATSTIDATIKPNTIWDPTRYCNIWVTQLQGGLLGYATFPAGTSLTGLSGPFGTATTDGVVCGHNYTGNTGTAASPPFNGGRTLVHELGHWLGLRHINGDSNCGNDFVADTPTQDALHGGCISSATPYHVNACGAGTSPNGEMSMNYMDYTDDACMYMFTAGQKARVQQCMVQGTHRMNLSASASTLCVMTATAPTASISIATTGCVGAAITTTNSSTGVPSPTYLWSTNPAGGVFSPNNTATNPTITFPSATMYTVTCVATNSLGSNSNSKAISITTCAAVCKDTITNVQSTATLNLATAGTDTSTPGCSPKAGYIFGSNCYDDLEKAEYFTQSMYASISTPKITDVIVIFYKDGTRGTGGNNSTPVNLKLYNGTMAGGPTGTTTPIATSTANIGAILAAAGTTSVNYCGMPGIVYTNPILRPFKYTFPTNPAAPATNGFFASVTIPTASGDTAVVMSDNTLTTGTNWELWSPNGWYNVSPTWGGFDASMAILPIISCSVTTGIAESELAANVNLMPNPTTGVFNIVTTLPNVKDIHLTVTNAIGQQITEADLISVTSGVFTVDLSAYNNGVYFITLQTNGERVVKRVVVSK